MAWAWPEKIGSCERVWPLRKLVFSVKKVGPAESSTVSGRNALEAPSSGRMDQRLVPRFTSREELVLAGGHGDGEAGAKDEVLLVVTEFLQIHRRGTVEVDGALDACVDEAIDGALNRLASEDCIAAEPAIGCNDVDLGGLTPEIEDVAIAEQGARGREVRIGKGERGVGREAALGERVADAEEVHADWRVGIGARLDILSSCGGRCDKKQWEEDKRPGRLTAMHSSGCGSANDQCPGVTG